MWTSPDVKFHRALQEHGEMLVAFVDYTSDESRTPTELIEAELLMRRAESALAEHYSLFYRRALQDGVAAPPIESFFSFEHSEE